jgi:hypothetical protein
VTTGCCRDSGRFTSLAGGLVAGLCQCLELNARVQDLVAYVYTLLGSESGQALAVSRMMLDRPVDPARRLASESSKRAGHMEGNVGYVSLRAD